MLSKRETIEQSLQEIWDERTRLTPGDVVEVAAVPGHPLHSFFEWQDSEAARKYRLMQAAGLIRSVTIKFTVERGGEVEDLQVRRWVAARRAAPESDAPEGYMPEENVRQDPVLRAAVLRQMIRDLQSVRRRHQHLSEFWELMGELIEEHEATG